MTNVEVAACIGWQPCDSWVPFNMGSAGGPCHLLVKAPEDKWCRSDLGEDFPLCPHEAGKCYPRDKEPPFLHDDALAWRVLVPWLRGKGYRVQIIIEHDDAVMVGAYPWEARASFSRMVRGPNALAHACCQVVVAVGGKESA